VGKSWLTCALGHKACREGFPVLYRRAARLFAELATARGEGRLPRLTCSRRGQQNLPPRPGFCPGYRLAS
jgi:DNA replication protein DnaC